MGIQWHITVRHFPTQSGSIPLMIKKCIPLCRLDGNGSIIFWERKWSSTQTTDPCSSYRHKGSCKMIAIRSGPHTCNSFIWTLSTKKAAPTVLTTVLNSCGHETFNWLLLYKSDPKFGHTYNTLLEGKQVPNFHLQDALLCHLGHLCVPSSKRAKMIWEAHYSRVAGHFGVEKTVAVLQKYFYWPNLDRKSVV